MILLTYLLYMKKIITKEKGDIGLTQVIADLTKNGINVALPISEHLPFDLIAISEDGKLSRVSVKYSGGEDIVKINLRTISSNSKGYNVKQIDFNDIDSFAVYSPITNKCYYVNKNKIKVKNTFSMRLIPVESKSVSKKTIEKLNFAESFKDVNNLWK